jgi:hypothetical protein
MGDAMRTSIVIAIVVAIGLAWSFAAMSKWVPIDSAEMSSAKMAKAQQ